MKGGNVKIRYKGEYVAIVNDKIAAHGSNAKEVWKRARDHTYAARQTSESSNFRITES